MGNKHLKEYLTLIQETRQYIQKQLPRKKSESRHFCSVKIEPAKKKTEPLQAPVIKESPLPARALPTKVTAVKVHSWELQPMGQISENNYFVSKLSKWGATCDPKLSVLLMLPEENAAHRFFLESVSRTITRSFAPAGVVLFHEEIVQKAEGAIFFIPDSVLKKYYPDAKAYQVIKKKGSTIIVLENLDRYNEYVESKRALWKAIQDLFQS